MGILIVIVTLINYIKCISTAIEIFTMTPSIFYVEVDIALKYHNATMLLTTTRSSSFSDITTDFVQGGSQNTQNPMC